MLVKYIDFSNITDKYKPSIVAIGSFDGVHLGHQKVINRAIERALQFNVLSGVIIFEPHPLEVLNSQTKVEQITPISSKIIQLEALGVDICYVIKFTECFSSISEIEFIDEILIKLNVKGIVVGYDFTFGNKALGNTNTFQELNMGRYSLDIIEPFFINNEKVSSTRIREYLKTGNVIEANKLLGRGYSFKGKVVHGDGRGKSIGFPTVNLELLEEFIMVKNGVYLVCVTYLGYNYKGVMNVGFKPTFNDKGDNIVYEVHIIDFEKDIYDKILEVELIDYIREEIKYNSVLELKKQIRNDIVSAEHMFSKM